MIYHHTQFSPGPRRTSQTVIIGLDFGTSSSKVVIQNRTERVAFAIPFGRFGHPSNPYLIPSRPYFNKSGEYCLSDGDDGIPLRELKGSLMGNDVPKFTFCDRIETNVTAELLAICHLSHIISKAREWYITNKRNTFGNHQLDWHLNIGIPTIGRDLQERKIYFRELAKKAWWLSTQKGKLDLEKAKLASETKFVPLQDIHADNINAIPEIIAEVVGYTESNLKAKGLHLLIDVGAGTLDIASFNLGEDQGGNRYSIFTGDVAWLGAFELHKARIKKMKSRVEAWIDEFGKDEDPVSAIPNDVISYVPDAGKIKLKQLTELEQEFLSKCKAVIQKTIIALRERRDPNSNQWKQGIRTFLCGGGSQVNFYSDAFSEVNDYWQSIIAEFKLMPIPKPENLQMGNLPEEDFYRFAVAYGLSFTDYDIGSYLVPSEIPDMSKQFTKDYRDNYIDKDHM